MPQVCKDMRTFLEKLNSRPQDKKANAVKVYETKKNGKIVTKFKLTTRCGGLFTLTCDHPTAMKFEKALPPSVIQDIRRVKKATKARN